MDILTENLSGDQVWNEFNERIEEMHYLNSPDFSFAEYARRFPQFLIGGA